MIEALSISESGLRATQKWIDNISNNVANMQTPGYKKVSTNFVNLVHGNNGENASEQVQTSGGGTRVLNTTSVFSDGAIKQTANPLDIAIQGDGLIEVNRENGKPAYTRMTRLQVNATGQLQTISGFTLSDDIRIPADVAAIEIDNHGVVRGKIGQSGEIIEIGQIRLAKVNDPQLLTAINDGLYEINDSSAEVSFHTAGENGMGSILQGYTELSNVDLVEEMTSLVVAQRSYQLNARIIQTADQIMETINNLRR